MSRGRESASIPIARKAHSLVHGLAVPLPVSVSVCSPDSSACPRKRVNLRETEHWPEEFALPIESGRITGEENPALFQVQPHQPTLLQAPQED